MNSFCKLATHNSLHAQSVVTDLKINSSAKTYKVSAHNGRTDPEYQLLTGFTPSEHSLPLVSLGLAARSYRKYAGAQHQRTLAHWAYAAEFSFRSASTGRGEPRKHTQHRVRVLDP